MNDEGRRQLITVAQTIGMQAMELPAERRAEFIRRSVTAIHRDYAQKYGGDASTAELADRLEKLTATLVKLIEESGGSIGNA
jgi:hypothetical protein